MRIEDVQSIVAGDLHFVIIQTDEGSTGVGQSAFWAYPGAVDAIVRAFKPMLVREDPLRIEHHWHTLYRMGPFRGGALSAAISAIDIALWDLKGKHLQAPIWELIGGSYRDRVRLCAFVDGPTVDESLTAAREAVEEGYSAIKIYPLRPGYQDMAVDKLIRTAVEYVGEVRSIVGSDVDLVLELLRKMTPASALPLISALQQFNPLFIEDPIQVDGIVAQSELGRMSDAPLGIGEKLHTVWEFNELLGVNSRQYIRPDPCLAGGFSHFRKIAAVAEAHQTHVVPHNAFGPIQTAVCAHLDIATSNFLIQEYNRADEDRTLHHAIRNGLEREGGYLLRPSDPGLGVSLDASALRPDDYQGYTGNFIYNKLVREDGSIAMAT